MKVYALGNIGFVTPRVAETLGMRPTRRQARVLVAAPSKAEAFRLLSLRGMAPSSIHDEEFRVAMGDDVDVLAGVGLFDAPAVLALDSVHSVSEVVRVEPDGGPTLLGRTERAAVGPLSPLRFIPTAAGVHGPVWTEPMSVDAIAAVVAEQLKIDLHRASELIRGCLLGLADHPSKWNVERAEVAPEAIGELLNAVADQHASEAEYEADLVAACEANRKRVEKLNDELARLHTERQQLALRAVKMDLVAEAARAFGLSTGRIYQLKDAALVARATARRKAESPATPKRSFFFYGCCSARTDEDHKPGCPNREVGGTPTSGKTASMVVEVQKCVAAAISQRIGYISETELVEVREHSGPGSVFVHVNSGGNSLTAEEALRRAGYEVAPAECEGSGSALLVTRAR